MLLTGNDNDRQESQKKTRQIPHNKYITEYKCKNRQIFWMQGSFTQKTLQENVFLQFL